MSFKPCPFCGATEQPLGVNGELGMDWAWWENYMAVECPTCGAQGPRIAHDPLAADQPFQALDAAKAAWNKRATTKTT
jgi:Lar family restriction alleviation protein